MKVLLATPIYPPEIGGPATYTKELSHKLHAQHAITVLTYADNAEAFPHTRLHAISKQQPLPLRLINYFVAALGETASNDVIYVQNAMAAGLPIALACMLRRKPFILKFVGDESWERARQYRMTEKRLEEFLAHPEGGWRIRAMMRIQKFVLQRATFVTTPSAYLRDELVRYYHLKPHRVIVNYNAAEEPSFSPFPSEPKLHQIVATARLTSWKGIDGIIRAIAILAKKIPDAHLVVAGDGPEENALKKLVRELDLEKQVTFLGNISRAETWQLRKNSAVYVLNSTYEGLPHTALTTFAARIPIVATNIPGTNEAVIDGETGLLVEPGDDAGLAAAIERLFSDATLRTRLVENASRYLEEKFSWEAHIAGLEGLFQSVLPEPRNKA